MRLECKHTLCGPRCETTCIWGLVNNKGVDQRSPISTFVICLLESIISRLATNEISIFYLVSVAEHAFLGMNWMETPETGFTMWRSLPCNILCKVLVTLTFNI